jgi:hypothetical protein
MQGYQTPFSLGLFRDPKHVLARQMALSIYIRCIMVPGMVPDVMLPSVIRGLMTTF